MNERTPRPITPCQSFQRRARRSSSRCSLTSSVGHEDRFFSCRKLETAPGFNLATPHSKLNPQNKELLKFAEDAVNNRSKGLLSKGIATSYRALPSQSSKILDAPDLLDDYYLNLLAWSDSNLLAVALRHRLYLWNGNNGSVSQLLDTGDDNKLITSVSWMQGGQCLAIGDSEHAIQVFDINANRRVRNINVHSDRVSSLAWNGYVLSSGSRDSSIVQHDLRVEQFFVKCTGHEQEVCGLAWSKDGTQLASGGNDNKLFLWDLANSSTPRAELKGHNAAVKALAWCPWKTNLLASGGGAADRCIRLWNSTSATNIKTVNTGSQVCALEWNKHDKELLSAHGYANNQLTLWSYPDMSKISEFTGHTARVLFMAQNPEGSTVVSAAADETIRFWNIFESSVKQTYKPGTNSPSGMSFCCR